MSDPEYRYYNCNLQCPNLKTKTIYANSANISTWSPSGISTENGFLDYTNIFDIAPTALLQENSVGELTVYLKNNSLDKIQVLMIIVTKASSVIVTALPYQTVGNFTTSTVTILNSTTVRITTNPYCVCSWFWRGI